MGKIYTMYHGTTAECAESIRKYGFKPSKNGALGKGVYLTVDLNKAINYARTSNPSIIEVTVDVGKTKTINYQGHPLQKRWHQNGYDSAWAPEGAVGRREETCIWDPSRIEVVRIFIQKHEESYSECSSEYSCDSLCIKTNFRKVCRIIRKQNIKKESCK